MIAVDCLAGQAAHVDERPESDFVRTAREQVETDSGDDAILADERHHVGQRANRGDLDEAREPVLPAGLAAKRLHEFQRDADAGQVLVRIGAIVALRVDDGERRRQRRVRLVMVGDDQIDAELAGAARRLDAADAAIDGDHEHDAVGVQPFDRGRLQAVAVAQPLRDEVHDVSAEHLERAPQNHRRRDPVDVVVPMDCDPLPPRDGAHDAIDRHAHVREGHWIVEVIERRVQKASRDLRIREAALTQQPRHNRRHVDRGGEPRSRRVVAR